MIKIITTMLIAVLVTAPFNAQAITRAQAVTKTVAKQCPTILGVQDKGLFIYKNSAPIRSGGVGTPLIGFRDEPTLIMNRNVSSRGWTTIYDSKGNSLGRCPWADAHGHSGGRYRCTMNTRTLRRAAVKNTKSPLIYIRLTAKTCVSVPDAGKCYGSVKGKCNSTLT
jgi:hypothetical protein